LASAKRRQLAREVRRDINRTGFLPTLSDILPSTGEKMNCIKANEANKTLSTADPALKVSAKKGKRGKIIPKPVASMKIVITTIMIGENPNAERLKPLVSILSSNVFSHSQSSITFSAVQLKNSCSWLVSIGIRGS
jgi:hypothetical protein